MKVILPVLMFVLTSFGVYAQINFSATSLPPAMYGCGDWVTIDSSTNERAILIGGETANGAPGTNGAVKLMSQDSNLNWIEKYNFYLQADEPRTAFFYENNYVYIAFVTLFQELRIFRALMDGSANFTEVYSSYDIGYLRATITAIDINDDGFEDFLFSGYAYTGNTPDVGLIQNNGDGTFSSASPPANIPPANAGYYESGFLDNSGRKHLVIISAEVDAVFENQGNGVFTQVFVLENTPSRVHVAIIDLDNDGLNDISVTGPNGTSDSGTMLFKNLGNLDFQNYNSAYTGLPNTYYGETEYSDLNNDGYMDAIILGKLLDNTLITKILFGSDNFRFFGDEYIFTDQMGNPINLSSGTVDIHDYNSDGKPDVLLTGRAIVDNDIEPQTWLMTNTSTLSIDEFQQVSFTMYPNPARDIVSFKGIDAIKSVEVFNQLGQKVLSTKDAYSINIESLSTGMYLVQVQDANHRTFQKKLVVK
ncbi:T9SS type A sorting domain-containing protein [Xanthomarina sp. F2636L]|uniref:T9SS type A sorting domain-containing protein n=1 Tax=Xanthomarina sp. F2636L TaxID=2996018 RepID=UPI00225DCDEF|nr:T9SS type A sorting domain-containing protein [Xanthomarina sp. F2636L]MCX7551241.1 T9SS type A sorting domain-containing protein [Xanthomarina sp. F2636L]